MTRGARALLAVEDLSVEFRTRSGIVHALEHVGFRVDKGETVALVGESRLRQIGHGLSRSWASSMPRHASHRARRCSAALDLLTPSERDLAEMRGRELSMIFQNPRTALNPIRPVGEQIADVLVRHGSATRATRRGARDRVAGKVRIPDPERRADAYPFELSGGMCQRVMIAMALACGPALLIADEPTTGLDVTTQAVIMDLIGELARDRGMATIFITHDLALAAEYCDRIVVMHAGHIVETAPTAALFAQPAPSLHRQADRGDAGRDGALAELASIPGNLPDLRRGDLPACRYSDRCERGSGRLRPSRCRAGSAARERHDVACWNPL